MGLNAVEFFYGLLTCGFWDAFADLVHLLLFGRPRNPPDHSLACLEFAPLILALAPPVPSLRSRTGAPSSSASTNPPANGKNAEPATSVSSNTNNPTKSGSSCVATKRTSFARTTMLHLN